MRSDMVAGVKMLWLYGTILAASDTMMEIKNPHGNRDLSEVTSRGQKQDTEIQTSQYRKTIKVPTGPTG
jgi:hypothetical protein